LHFVSSSEAARNAHFDVGVIEGEDAHSVDLSRGVGEVYSDGVGIDAEADASDFHGALERGIVGLGDD